MHPQRNHWLTVLITSRKMNTTLLIRLFLNIARWRLWLFWQQ